MSNVMTGAAKTLVENFERERKTLPGASGWLDVSRAKALAAFAEAGLPHRRVEEWKYTDLRRLLDDVSLTTAPDHLGPVDLPATAFEAMDCYKLVLVNGRFRADLSSLAKLPKGVELHPLANVLSEQWAKKLIDRQSDHDGATRIIDLNTALMRDGMALRIRKGVRLDKPLHLVFLAADDGGAHARHLVELEEGASATIFQSHLAAGASSYFVDQVSDIHLGADARLEMVRLVDEGAKSFHLSSLRAELEAGADFGCFTLTMGGQMQRQQSFVRFNGEGAVARVNGASALRGRQMADTFCHTDHAVPACASDTLYRTVLDGSATGTFQGKVVVQPDAQKTDGRQMTNALLLSREASMNAKPELEIYADDVQCAHGSTIGELNKDAIFYLRARGLNERDARRLLVTAFLDEALDRIAHDGARDALRAVVANWFSAEGAAT
ncbi:MAG: Fe-S cluster assembly protein SufD [Rhizobiales bacterium]|nr:Fe-S cluster assembly protein SufD [Hyphomicrobiales bacterium]